MVRVPLTNDWPVAMTVPATISTDPAPTMLLPKVWLPLTSNLTSPLSEIVPPTEPLWALVPSPSTSVAPVSMVVEPEKLLVLVRVSVPPEILRPPLPVMWPEKLPLAAVRVRVSEPRVTAPDPERVLIEVPEMVWEMLKVPLSTNPEESLMAPSPMSVSLAPGSILVRPV